MEKQKKQDYNSLTAIITILASVIFGIMTLMIPEASIGNPMAPKHFPLGLSIIMLFLGVVLLIRSDFEKTKEAIKSLMNSTKEDKKIGKFILMTSAICILYALVFDVVGYIIATFLFMQLMLLITNGKEKWKINTIVSLIFSGSIYYVFNNLLNVILPNNPFLQ
jgi:putative tricarboxylic transport membrane protein